MTTRLLPVGTQDFEDIRKRNCLYIDKTDMIYRLVQEGKVYFISRPRRFGKSLLVSTLDAYFSAKKELFNGLAMEMLEKDWVEYPVIKVDFAQGSYKFDGRFQEVLGNVMRFNYEKYGIEYKPGSSPSEQLNNLIKALYDKTGRQVVVLVDEYDKPILDALFLEHEARNRELLRDFYSPLKSSDAYLKFVFLTGITKVSHVNIFSGLNQLSDISCDERYSAVCGITEKELFESFKPEIQLFADKYKLTFQQCTEKLKSRYDGYHFSAKTDEDIYNPYCLLKALDSSFFGSYWVQSGTPTMLVRQLENNPVFTSRICDNLQVKNTIFDNYDPYGDDPTALLYQSGYLTIKSYDYESEFWTIGFPNEEVREGLLDCILPKYLKTVSSSALGITIEAIKKAMLASDIEKLCKYIGACIADIPTILKEESCENYYESVVHIMLTMTGFRVISEYQLICGRSDIVVETPKSVYIFELKMDNGSADIEKIYDEAFRQIEEKGYAGRYAAAILPVHKVALVFSSQRKGLVGAKWL